MGACFPMLTGPCRLAKPNMGKVRRPVMNHGPATMDLSAFIGIPQWSQEPIEPCVTLGWDINLQQAG